MNHIPRVDRKHETRLSCNKRPGNDELRLGDDEGLSLLNRLEEFDRLLVATLKHFNELCHLMAVIE